MSGASQTAAIALGSNLGDRRAHVERAIEEIGALSGVRVVAASCLIETDPIGGPAGQSSYLNGALVLETTLGPGALLRALQQIEFAHGRDRSGGVRNAPRTLDLDLLVHGDEVVESAALCLPHPRMHERAFVLEPLAEIAPDLVVPRHQRSVRDLLHALHGAHAGNLAR